MGKATEKGIRNFFLEMENHQISAQEFFNPFMLESLERNFGLSKVIIMYFDTVGRFLSWTDKVEGNISNINDGSHKTKDLSGSFLTPGDNQSITDETDHPYMYFESEDIVRQKIYEEAVNDHLTYFDIEPRLYRGTDIVKDYGNSSHAAFLKKNFSAHYSLTMAFGINAYIQLVFLRDKAEGDFSDKDVEHLRDIYSYIATAYKNFKKYEQIKIISKIQGEIIASGEKAYLITDDFMHILDHSSEALKRLEELMGVNLGSIDSDTPCNWLPFLLGVSDLDNSEVHNRTIKNYIYTIHDYRQRYSNGIVDLYHWITIHKEEHEALPKTDGVLYVGTESLDALTKTEQKVARLMAKGYTYKEIASTMVISYHTVKKHVENIYEKCHVNSRYQLMQVMKKS
ncbi:response regulator transcription factor [Oribacterium sp. P6A1]|uniref:response regulator transcription factor n=1 Tax=Oribacterium sp. P6A1 TaxID=1410612 RepID=UPI00056193EF|nr:LuxR C-terminal-related transcriptional regulator [Oribacterium sp. P6A1]